MVARPDTLTETALPVVVIVGRPNVGKSTLFNAILGQRRSIVGDEPGITRDRIQGEAAYLGRRFELIDTGGIIPNDAEMIPTEILKQARVALDQAAQIIFLIDGRTEITGTDRDLAKMLRKLGKPVTLAVNKIDATVARGSGARISFARLQGSVPDFGRAPDRVRRAARARHEGFHERRRPRRAAAGEAPDQSGDHRPAERRKIHAAERAGGTGARHCVAGGRHHARRGGSRACCTTASSTSSSTPRASGARARPS